MSTMSSSTENRELTLEQKRSMTQTLVGAVASYIAEDEGVDIETAFERFFASSVALKLEEFGNLLYREGPGYIYDLYRSGI